MNICPKCNTANPSDTNYCFQCGEALSEEAKSRRKACPKCKTENNIDANYCKKCSTAISDDAREKEKNAQKKCPECFTENIVDANYCRNCGRILTDNKEVLEMDKLSKAKETIQLLKKAFPAIEEKNRNLEKEKKELTEKQQKLTKKQESLSAELLNAQVEIESLNNRIRPLKKDRNYWIISFLIMLGLFVTVLVFLIFNHNSLSGKQEKITQLRQNIETLERKNKELAGEKEKIEKLKSNEKTNLTELKKKVTELEQANSQLVDEKNSLTEKNTELVDEKNRLKKENTQLADDKSKLQNQINAAAEYCPIVIQSIKVCNTYKDGTIETDYGKTIYASSSMFLSPQIEYVGLKTGQTITLYTKLYAGKILQYNAKDSLSGYTYKTEITVSSTGKTGLSGWGDEKKGHWKKGDYRYEVWYDGKLLKKIDFQLY
ncbi:MAG: zinc ribbon domain-containing protein [Prevotellaceae bacterium]|jgi:peptidoglycan hydrolase CwlO-like protein/ribosomal protein L40E|nr:zinc ribbon domain-containing protein [Prevotellaceae bacterium]